MIWAANVCLGLVAAACFWPACVCFLLPCKHSVAPFLLLLMSLPLLRSRSPVAVARCLQPPPFGLHRVAGDPNAGMLVPICCRYHYRHLYRHSFCSCSQMPLGLLLLLLLLLRC